MLCAPRRCSIARTRCLRRSPAPARCSGRSLEEGWQLSTEQASLSWGGGSRAASSGAPFEAPSQTPIHAWAHMLYPPHSISPWLCCPGRRAPSPGLSPGNCTDGTGFLSETPVLLGQGSANPRQSAARSFLSVPFLARGSPTKSWRPTFPSLSYPAFAPPFLASPGDRGVLGARQDKFGWAAPLKSLASHVAGKWVPQWGPQTF